MGETNEETYSLLKNVRLAELNLCIIRLQMMTIIRKKNL